MDCTIGSALCKYLASTSQAGPLDWLEYAPNLEWWQLLLVLLFAPLGKSHEGRRVLSFALFLPFFYFTEWMEDRKDRRRRRRRRY